MIEQLQVNEKVQEIYRAQLEQKVRLRTEELSKKNEENVMLLGEIHHRVKNNLANHCQPSQHSTKKTSRRRS